MNNESASSQAPCRITVTEAEATMRLDRFLHRHFPEYSRSQLSRWISQGHIIIFDARGAQLAGELKPSRPVHAGEGIQISPPEPAPSALLPSEMPLTILFQDEHLAVVDKPAGIVTHPSLGHAQNTLVNALLHHCRDLSGIGGELRPGIVHRLDKDTSGLLLVAKHDRAHQLLSAGIQTRRIARMYAALVWGTFQTVHFEVINQLGRDPADRKRFKVVRHGGKEAHSRFTVRTLWDHVALLEVALATGRTHQIRVHCQNLGHPILGDRTYGLRGEGKRCLSLGIPRPERQMLHARRLSFQHPWTQEEMDFTSPLPKDFAEILAALGPGRSQAPAGMAG